MRHWLFCGLFGVTTLSHPTIEAVAQGRADAIAAEAMGKQPARSADELRDARDRLKATARKLRSEGKLLEAAEAREQMLAVEREWLGEDHEETIPSLEWLAEVYEELEDFDAAEAKRKTILNWRERQQGENHWETIDARLAVSDVARVRALEGTQRRELAEATRQYQEISRLYRTGAYPTAVKLAKDVLLIHKRLLGEEHPLYAASLSNLGILYESMGDFARAETLYTQFMETTRKVKGDEHPDYAHCLNNLADLHSRQGAYAKAEPIYRQALKIRKKTLGEQHLDYGISLNSLAALHVYAGEHARAAPLFKQALEICRKTLGEQHPSYATGLANLAQVYRSTEDFARAEPLLKQALEIRRKAFGEEHPDYASCLDDLGCLYSAAGDFERAEPPLKRAREIRKKAFGEQHPNCAYSLNNLADLYSMRGEYAKAEPLYTQALEIRRKTLGEQHPDYLENLRNLGALYRSTGDFAEAEPILRQAVEIAGKAVGAKHPKYAQALNSLGALYYSMEDYARAEPVYRLALEIRKTVFGEEHPDYVASLNNLAELYRAMADYAKAEPLFKQALEIIARMGGEERPLHVTTLNNLALLHRSAGDYSEAKSLLQQVVEIGKKAYGEEHPRHATSLNNLAELHHLTGDYAGAETLYKRALMIHKLCLGDEHPLYANTLRNLGLLYYSVGDYPQAQSLCRQAVEITATHIDATAVALTERQQLAFAQRARRQLDSYVSCLVRLKNRDDQAYRTVLDWKGATLVRQRAARLVADQPKLKPLFDNLQSVTLRWATLARSTMQPEKIQRWREQLADLAAEREKLEAELSRSSAIYREGRQKVTLSDLRAVLPVDAALIDFLEFSRHSWFKLDVDGATAGRKRGEWRSERSLLAFVVRPGHEVRMFDLGPVAPLGDAIDTWRRTHGMSREALQAGQLLRQKIWQPMQEALGEAGVVLVSPDGVLGRLPIGALPGKKPSTYLLQDHRLAMVAVPRLIPALLDDHDRKELDKELLLLGGVDYNQRKESNELKPAAGPHRRRRPERRGEMRELTGELFWRELTGAAEEVALIGDLYQKLCDLKPEEFAKEIAELSGAQATESRFRDLAPECYLLHLATHGFFCAPGNQSALASEVVAQVDHRLQAYPSDVRREALCGHTPGLLSGLVFAGANDPPQIPDDPSRLEEVPDDGYLTADEIAFLPLDGVQLVVLSACETGLGEVAGGEGLLGIQRAFQVSGARTTVASLWKVDDAATQILMVEFYRNLWEKKLGKLEALRQAQLAMLNNYDPQEGELRSGYRRDKPRPNTEMSDRVPPRYWAAFVLSGDWR